MAYTGVDEDGGVGYVTKGEPEADSWLKRQISKLRHWVAGLFG